MSDDHFSVLMERRVKFRPSTDVSVKKIVIQVGYPKWIEENITAVCPVSFVGGIGRVKDIPGIDLLNAMKQALMFIESYLMSPQGDGKFFWDDDEEYTGG